MIAQVAFSISLYKTFDYLIPEALLFDLKIGARVEVPFGTKTKIGIVVNRSQSSSFAILKLKPILRLIDRTSLFSEELWKLLNWAASYYHYPLGEVLFHALPVLVRQGQPLEPQNLDPKTGASQKKENWQVTEKGQNVDSTTLKLKNQRQVLELLQHNQIVKLTAPNRKTLIQLQDQGLVQQLFIDEPEPKPWVETYQTQSHSASFELNEEQKQAIQTIGNANGFTPFLLEGVTGSGKTEVYLNAIDPILAQGKQVLVLVPEIGLTPQTMQRFAERFKAPIAMLHSQLSDKARFEIWQKTKHNQIALIIGTRSALFSPFTDLGLIVIDEEHDNSYKQQEGFRYHARDLAIMRARENQIPIILGSATPSFETLHNADQNRYHRLALTQRAGSGSFVQEQVLDIRGFVLTAGISAPLMAQIEQELEQDNQVLLFLNRRGFAPVLMCHDCGWIAECPHCDSPFNYHQKKAILICHHCHLKRAIPKQCIDCGSTHLMPVGVGTEQIEVALKARFPEIPVLRIDRDTTQKKQAFHQYLEQIAKGGKQILIGTQMLAKGHHFPDVTLVGILDVDGALYSTQFKATEQFAQLYTQVSGRAGREVKKGKVVLQTHHPEHSLLQTLLNQGYLSFAKEALKERQMLALPPFSYHALIKALDKNNQNALIFLQKVVQFLNQSIDKKMRSSFLILGPEPTAQLKRAGFYSYQIILQHSNRIELKQILQQLVLAIETWTETKKIKWYLDVDPFFY